MKKTSTSTTYCAATAFGAPASIEYLEREAALDAAERLGVRCIRETKTTVTETTVSTNRKKSKK